MKKTDCAITDPQNDLGYLIWQIMKFWQRGKFRMLEEFGLTGSQMEVLSAAFHLGKSGQEVTQIAISNLTNVDPMTTSTILKNLERKKLIERKPSTIDTRARVVEVTESGSELFQRAVSKVDEATSVLLEHVDGDALKEQLRSLLKALNMLHK